MAHSTPARQTWLAEVRLDPAGCSWGAYYGRGERLWRYYHARFPSDPTAVSGTVRAPGRAAAEAAAIVALQMVHGVDRAAVAFVAKKAA